MKTALITGHAGFLGRHFKRKLERDGWSVRGVDPRATWTWGMPNDAVTVFTHHAVRQQFDLVIHCAARSPHRKAIDTDRGAAAYNQLLDAAMFNWAIETRQPRVLYVSSSAVYSHELRHPTLGGRWTEVPIGGFPEHMGYLHEPFDSYGETKRAGEKLAAVANQCGVKTTIIRPFSGYGSDQSADFPFGAFLKRAVDLVDPFTIWGDADQRRDFVHVDDIVDGALTLVERGVMGPVNICTGVATSMRELAKTIIDCRSDAMAYRHTSTQWAMYQPMIEVDEKAPLGVHYRVGDPSLLHQFYTPRVTVHAGVERAVREALGDKK